jgi:hypothetical protein
MLPGKHERSAGIPLSVIKLPNHLLTDFDKIIRIHAMNKQKLEQYLAKGEPAEEGWMLKRLGVSRLTVIEWSITMSETSLEIARIYEPEKASIYEKDLLYLKAERAKELAHPTIVTHRQ